MILSQSHHSGAIHGQFKVPTGKNSSTNRLRGGRVGPYRDIRYQKFGHLTRRMISELFMGRIRESLVSWAHRCRGWARIVSFFAGPLGYNARMERKLVRSEKSRHAKIWP